MLENNCVFDSKYINGIHFEESFGKYNIYCKAGYFCNFNLMQLSNQPHFHDCYELYIATSGEGSFIYGKHTYNVKQWDIFIADPEMTHEICVNPSQDLQLVYFQILIEAYDLSSPKTLEDVSIYNFLNGHKVVAKSQQHLFAYLLFINEYFSAKKSRGYGIEQALKNLVLESLDTLSFKGGSLSKVRTPANTFELALDYIDQNLNNKISISEMARELSVSERTLQYLFRKHMNKTIVNYVNEKKMTLAAHHLIKQFSVSETANQIGIANTSQFTRLFKKHIGVSPKKYQQLHISKIKDFGRRQLNPENFITLIQSHEED